MLKNNKTDEELQIIYKPIPTEENIEYVFQKIVVSLIFSKGFNKYSESAKDFEKLLNTVISWLEIYSNSKKLKHIQFNDFKNVKDILFNLDEKYMLVEEWYAQQAYEWLLQLEVLITKEGLKEE